MSWPIALAFLLSGFAGLMHEIVWSRMLEALIGTTAHARAAVLIVYMGGLAIGSIWFGKRADRYQNPLRTYLVLEFAIAAYCVALPFALALTSSAYIAIASVIFESAQLKFALRFAMAVCTILIPAVWMGGTLPLLARHSISAPAQTRSRVALLYALNNFGAVIGAAAAGFVTLPWIGVYGSLATAAAMNVAAGLLVVPVLRGSPTPEPSAPDTDPGEASAPAYPAAAYRATLVALAMSGFAAMGYEVVFIRVINLSFGATTYSFTVMLMCFITGIGLGSLLLPRLRIERPLWWLGTLQLVAGVAFLAATPLMERLPYYVGWVRILAYESGQSFALYQLGKAALCLAVLLVPTMCLGASFPLVAAVQARQASGIGSYVGTTYACNTIGNVLGVLITTIVLLPTVGLVGAFHVNVALSFAAGILVLAYAVEAAAGRRLASAALPAAALVVYASVGTGWAGPLLYGFNHMNLVSRAPADAPAEAAANHPSAGFDQWKQRYVIDPAAARTTLVEEAHANVLSADVFNATRLIVNTKTDASTLGGDLETQLLLAHAPLFSKLDASTLLVIGYGSGITLGSALRHPIERADVVEISDGVLAVDRDFATHNYHVLQDPRVHVYIDDAQSFLNTVPRSYDIIISEPSNPWIAGIAGLFTVEFFEFARAKLTQGGVFALWFHQYEQSEEAIRLILRTFQSVFPYVSLYTQQAFTDIIAIGTVEAPTIDASAMEDRFDRAEVRDDLARIGISNLISLLSHHAVSSRAVPEIAGDGPLNRTIHQRLEYAAVRAMFHGDSSGLVEKNSPLVKGEPGAFVDAYTGYRAQTGEPVRPEELVAAAEHMTARGFYGKEFDYALRARAEIAAEIADAASVPSRPARGAVPNHTNAGYHESIYWAARLDREGDSEAAAAFRRRADTLRPVDP